MYVSIVMPVLNEARQISNRLRALKASFECTESEAYEIIVVDGGSLDASVELAQEHADHVIRSAPGRALQMNAGAAAARGEILVFLHVDTVLSAESLDCVAHARHTWGWFKVHLSGKHFMFRVIERMMNLRSRLTHVATGDQTIFVARELFNKVGGFPEIALMEDVALSKLLRKQAKPLFIQESVTTSSRRWRHHGIIKTILLMWWLRLLYFLGVSPARLVRLYY